MTENNGKPDFELTGEELYLREGSHRLESIIAMGNICMHLEFLTDAVTALMDKLEETNNRIADFCDSMDNSLYRIADTADFVTDPTVENTSLKVTVEGGDIMAKTY